MCLLLVGFMGQAAEAQQRPLSHAGGVTLQAYPAGTIVALHGAISLGQRDALRGYAAYNITHRRDFGEHEDERGGGPGAGVAWRHYFGSGHHGLHVGPRIDMWLLAVDWIDHNGLEKGSTSLVVLQPTAQLGYTWQFGNGRFALAATAALGAEINVITEGEDVGQGAILLLGVSISKRSMRTQ